MIPRPSDSRLCTRYSWAPSAGILLIIDTSNDIKCPGKSWMFSSRRHFLFQRWKYVHPQLPAKVWNTDLSSLPPLPLKATKVGPGKPTQHGTQLLPQMEKLHVAPWPFITSLWSAANHRLLHPCPGGQNSAMPISILGSFLLPTANHHSSWMWLFVQATKTYNIFYLYCCC